MNTTGQLQSLASFSTQKSGETKNRLPIPRISLQNLLDGLHVPIDVCKTLERALKWDPDKRSQALEIAMSICPSK